MPRPPFSTSPSRFARIAVIAAAALVALPVPAAEPDGDDPAFSSDDRPAIGPLLGGRLARVGGDDLGLLGDVWADVPLGSPGAGNFFTSWFARSAISDTTSDFAFTVRDLEYRLDLGWRLHLRQGAALSVSSGVRGRSEVDRLGRAWVRYVALGFASRHFGRESEAGASLSRVSWQLAAGPVIDESAVRADAVVQGTGRARLFGERLALQLEVDGLIDGGRSDFDVTFGPGIDFPIAGGRRMSLFLRYLDAGNPLGIRDDAWLAGFEYSEGPTGFVRPGRAFGPDIGGTLAAGAGHDSRQSARMLMRFEAPEMARELRIAFTLDANVLTAEATDELYYLYDLGVERGWRSRSGSGDQRGIAGAYFYHRSNHQLDHAGSVTSINVAEAGAETAGWRARGHRPEGRLGSVDARLRVGYLINSDFGLDHRWHARGGLRWRMPFPWGPGGGVVPFLRAEAESGDVNRREFAAGVFLDAFEFQIERRSDDQYFGADREATLLTAGYSF